MSSFHILQNTIIVIVIKFTTRQYQVIVHQSKLILLNDPTKIRNSWFTVSGLDALPSPSDCYSETEIDDQHSFLQFTLSTEEFFRQLKHHAVWAVREIPMDPELLSISTSFT